MINLRSVNFSGHSQPNPHTSKSVFSAINFQVSENFLGNIGEPVDDDEDWYGDDDDSQGRLSGNGDPSTANSFDTELGRKPETTHEGLAAADRTDPESNMPLPVVLV